MDKGSLSQKRKQLNLGLLYNFNFMSAIKWLALPEGAKVRMTREFLELKKWYIVTRALSETDDHMFVRFNSHKNLYYLKDDQWELIEEPRLPKQGEKVQVGDPDGHWYEHLYKFVCLYEDMVVVENSWVFLVFYYWRFPQEEVTLSDGKTYLVEERNGEKILKLKN